MSVSRTTFARMMLVAAMASIGLTVTPSRAAPVRQGSILIAGPTAADCFFSLNCLAWEQADCNPALLGADNGVSSSIVDVKSIAGSTRTFRLNFGSPTGVAPGGGSGAAVQFWTSTCSRITISPALPGTIKPGQVLTFKVPTNAQFMAVSAGFAGNLVWTLT